MFNYVLKMSIFINRAGVQNVFTISVVCNFLANIIFILELIIGKMEKIFQAWMILIIVFQIVIMSVPCLYFMISSERLYRPAKSFLKCFILISKRNSQIPRSKYIHLALFIEKITNKKKFAFSLGMIGKINRKNMFNIFPVYSSLIMTVLPLILSNKINNWII